MSLEYGSPKANKVLGQLKNVFVSRDLNIWKRLYTTYIRPHLEYAVSVWSPYLKKDINTLEKVQRRTTKVVSCLKKYPYEERCKRMGLTTLETRRVRGDLIQHFKITKGEDKVSWHSKTLTIEPRAGYRQRLRREIVRGCNQRHNFFKNRIVNVWNDLSNDDVNVETVNQFKIKIHGKWAEVPDQNLI